MRMLLALLLAGVPATMGHDNCCPPDNPSCAMNCPVEEGGILNDIIIDAPLDVPEYYSAPVEIVPEAPLTCEWGFELRKKNGETAEALDAGACSDGLVHWR